MEHLAIDLGGKESQICVRRSDGQIVEERRCRTATLPAYLATRPWSRVVVETCSEAFGIADAAPGLGHEVRVVPGTLVRSLGVGARRVKTDRHDAQVLSQVSSRIDLPSVYVPVGRRESARRQGKVLSTSRRRRPTDSELIGTRSALHGSF
jgi:transposase